MKDLLPLLQACPLFEGIHAEELQGMLGCLGGREVTIKKGNVLFQEGDPATAIGIILSGGVHLVREDIWGNRSILAYIGQNMLFGESYAFSAAEKLPVNIIADSDSHILLLDSRRITTCCSNACAFHAQVIFNLLRIVSNANLTLHSKIHVTSQRTTREKLIAYLLDQAKVANSSQFSIPYDRQALADYLEVDRSGLSVEISKLRKEGILICDKNHFSLLKMP